MISLNLIKDVKEITIDFKKPQEVGFAYVDGQFFAAGHHPSITRLPLLVKEIYSAGENISISMFRNKDSIRVDTAR